MAFITNNPVSISNILSRYVTYAGRVLVGGRGGLEDPLLPPFGPPPGLGFPVIVVCLLSEDFS